MSKSGTAGAPITFTAAPGASVSVSGKANGFALWGVSWVAVRDFDVTGTSDYGIVAGNASHITLAGNHVSYAGQPLSGATASGIRLSNVSDSLVSGNTSDHNSDNGILLTNGSTRNEVTGNRTFANARGYQRAATGIRVYSAPANTIASNLSHHNEDSGIECYSGSSDCLVYDNVTYDNGDHGIDDYQAPGARIVANSVYRNVTAGINVEGISTGAAVANNISVDNGIGSPRTHGNIRVEAGSTAGTTVDSDLVHLTAPDTLLIWNSTSYRTLAGFQAASGEESHGLDADPGWQSPAAGDFHLGAGSAAIDSADSGASGQPATDADANPRVNDPDSLDLGLGPRPYDDRGAYEFQPPPPPNSPPTASLVVSPGSGPAPLSVSADASASSDGDASPIVGFSFDFGDGSPPVGPQSQATAAHTYTAAGTYTVTVTVTDTAGLSSAATTQLTVDDPLAVPPGPGPPPPAPGSDGGEPQAGGPGTPWQAPASLLVASGPVVRPVAVLLAAKGQRLGRSVLVKASCAPACAALTAKGTLTVSRRTKLHRTRWVGSRFRLAAVTKPAWTGALTLRLRIGERARRAAVRALSRGGRVTATVSVTARPLAGAPVGSVTRLLPIGNPRR